MKLTRPHLNLTNGAKETKKQPHLHIYNPGHFPVKVTEKGQMLGANQHALVSSKDQFAIRAVKEGLVRVLSE